MAPLCRTNFCVLSKIFHSYLYTYKYTTTCIVFVNSKYFVCKLQATLHYIHMLSRFVPHPSSTSLFNFITFLIFLCDFFHLLDLNSNHNGSLYLPLPVNRFNYIQFFLESFWRVLFMTKVPKQEYEISWNSWFRSCSGKCRNTNFFAGVVFLRSALRLNYFRFYDIQFSTILLYFGNSNRFPSYI